VYKRRREVKPDSDDDGMDSDDREAMAAFQDEGFDESIAEAEAKRRKAAEKEAENKAEKARLADEEQRAKEAEQDRVERAAAAVAELQRQQEESDRPPSPGLRSVYVGGISNVSESSLGRAFTLPNGVPMGTIVDYNIPQGRMDIAFVEFSSSAEAEAVVKVSNGRIFEGRPLRVHVAKPKSGGLGSGQFPGEGMTEADRIATYGVGRGYINYAGSVAKSKR